MSDSWIKLYSSTYKPHLDRSYSGTKMGLSLPAYNRAEGFEIIFETLLSTKTEDFEIVETGTLRNPGNWKDGNSGYLFSKFLDHYGGRLRSVDVDSAAVERARNFLNSDKVTVHHLDSVEYLSSVEDLSEVDLFYLDSYDVSWRNDSPSAEHHFQEFLCIEPHLRQGSVVAIDDNSFLLDGRRTGKGRAIFEHLSDKGINPIYDGYQIIYKF